MVGVNTGVPYLPQLTQTRAVMGGTEQRGAIEYGRDPPQPPREESMITRTWRGWTRPEDTEAYAEYILETGIAEYKATPGNQGAYLISRPDGDRTES